MSFNNRLPRFSSALALAVVVAAVSLLLRLNSGPIATEQWYSRAIFPRIRQFWDASLGQIPFPLYYLFWVLIVLLLLRWLLGIKRQKGWKKRLIYALQSLTIFSCWLLASFLWLWGFNYGRNPVEQQLDFKVYSLSKEELSQSVVDGAAELAELRAKVKGPDTTALIQDYTAVEWEMMVRPLLVQALKSHHYPTPGRPRGRQLYPKGLLLRFSSAGVYWPWVAEGNVDAGNHPLLKAPILAHELAHAYGFGEEGTCSFWSWLAGEQAQSPYLRYAFRLHYWRDLARKWLSVDRDAYTSLFRHQLDPGVRQDIISIVINQRSYPDFLPAIRDVAYDTYLKSQGVQDGLLSYGRVVQLVEGYRRNFKDQH